MDIHTDAKHDNTYIVIVIAKQAMPHCIESCCLNIFNLIILFAKILHYPGLYSPFSSVCFWTFLYLYSNLCLPLT